MAFFTGSSDHVLSFFQGLNTSGCFYTSQTLRSDFSVMLLQFPLVCPFVSRDESSAKREFLTFLSCMCSGKLLINIQESRGSRMLPCGTPICMVPTADMCRLHKHTAIRLIGMTGRKGRQKSHLNILLIFAAGLCSQLYRRLS